MHAGQTRPSRIFVVYRSYVLIKQLNYKLTCALHWTWDTRMCKVGNLPQEK